MSTTAYHEGKLAHVADERNKATGSRSRCPYRVPDRVREWNRGYADQAAFASPQISTAEAEANRAAVCAAISQWLARNSK